MRPLLVLACVTFLARTATAATEELTATAPPGDAPTGYVGVGIASLPKYWGASERIVLPLIAARIAYKGMSAETTGQGARFDLLPLEGWALGPTVAFRLPSDDYGTAVEVGAYVGRDFFFDYGRTGLSLELEGRVDVSGVHDGMVGIGGVRGYRVLGAGFTASADLALVYLSNKVAHTYFGTGAGLGEADFGAALAYDLTKSWRMLGRIQVTQLLGGARDSEVVGSATGTTLGAAFTYAF